jgi:hypothetical protein
MAHRGRGSVVFVRILISPRLVASFNCQGGDSNPYGFLHQILSLARLPIPPPRQIATLTKLAALAAAGKLRLLRQMEGCLR